MIDINMWGFEPGSGFGASATDVVGADATAEQSVQAPEDLTFSARLAESLFGVVEEDADEESPDLPTPFALTPQVSEQIANLPAEAGKHKDVGARADGVPAEAGTCGDAGARASDPPAEAGRDVPAKAGRYVDAGAHADTIPDKAGSHVPATAGNHGDAGARASGVPAEGGSDVNVAARAESKAGERAVDAAPASAPTGRRVKFGETLGWRPEAGAARDDAPGCGSARPVQAADGPPAPTMRPHDALSSDERPGGDRQGRPLAETRVRQATQKSLIDFARPSAAEYHALQVTQAELISETVKGTPQLVAFPAPVPHAQTVGGEFEVASAPPETRGPLPRETADSIIQSLRMQYQQGGGDAVVHIKPEHLGPVTVSLRVDNGVVTAVVNADDPVVAEWLKANEHMLREGLASSGLHLDRFAVRRDGQPADDPRRHWRPPEPRGRRPRALQPESTFEVTV